MKKDRLLELLLRETDTDISEQEQLELDRWIQQSPDHQQMAEQIRAYWKSAGSLNPHISIDLERDYQIVKKKIGEKEKRYIGRFWPIAATILLLISLWFVFPYFSSSRTTQYLGPSKGITLSDGSILDLEDNSHFDFKTTKTSREGMLSGRGYFVVQPDVNRTFIISTDAGQVTVTGTSFAVDARAKDRLAVAVDEGKVMLKTNNGTLLEVNGGEQGIITGAVIEKDLLQQPAGFWRLAPIEFIQTPFAEVISQLETYYYVKLTVDQPKIADCKVNFTLSFPPLDELFAILETLLNINIEKIADTQYVIKGSGCS